jgi:hypothetical protein
MSIQKGNNGYALAAAINEGAGSRRHQHRRGP